MKRLAREFVNIIIIIIMFIITHFINIIIILDCLNKSLLNSSCQSHLPCKPKSRQQNVCTVDIQIELKSL